MVDHRSTESDREAMTRLKVAIVGLVGASAGLIAISGGGSFAEIALASLAGLGLGVVLLVYLTYIA